MGDMSSLQYSVLHHIGGVTVKTIVRVNKNTTGLLCHNLQCKGNGLQLEPFETSKNKSVQLSESRSHAMFRPLLLFTLC